jgi:hypothetical protein
MPQIEVKGSEAAAALQKDAPKQYSAEDFFIVLISSRAHKFFINTAFILAEVHHDLDKLLMVATSDAPTFEGGRNGAVEMLKRSLDDNAIKHGDVVRGLWIDDDVLIDEPIKRVSDAIREADVRHANIVANYRIPWRDDSIVNSIGISNEKGDLGHFATKEELDRLKNFDPLPMGSHNGLGFYYGDIPLNYRFHYDVMAEDVNFFRDNKIQLSYVDLKLRHNKNLLL